MTKNKPAQEVSRVYKARSEMDVYLRGAKEKAELEMDIERFSRQIMNCQVKLIPRE